MPTSLLRGPLLQDTCPAHHPFLPLMLPRIFSLWHFTITYNDRVCLRSYWTFSPERGPRWALFSVGRSAGKAASGTLWAAQEKCVK